MNDSGNVKLGQIQARSNIQQNHLSSWSHNLDQVVMGWNIAQNHSFGL